MFEDRAITYAEMDGRSNRVARGLAAAGIESGDRVAVLDKNSPAFFDVLFGAAKINAVTVPINWRLAPREVRHILEDSGARVVFVSQEFFPSVANEGGSLPTTARLIVLGEGAPPHPSYGEWVACQSSSDVGCRSDPERAVLQLYTSGTTGLPKGAILTHANLGTLVDRIDAQWGFDDTSVNAVAMPLFHIGGIGWALIGMSFRCKSVLFREFDPLTVLRAIERHRITNAFFVPAMLQFMTALPEATGHDYSSLRAVAYGGSPITVDVLVQSTKTFGCKFIQLYGLTETTGSITQLDAKDHDPRGPRAHLLRSAGKPYAHVELRIIDPMTGEDVEDDAVGEVWCRSSQTMNSYWNNPDATAKAITADGWFKTGDAGFRDREGYLFLTDRITDMIVSGGENIYPIEVENVLAEHPAVADVAVIGVPDSKWGESVKAVVVRKPGGDLEGPALVAFAREHLAPFKCPRSVDFVEVLPRNAAGKVLKRELRAPFLQASSPKAMVGTTQREEE
jgi:long-chain acyl-CoA synthetase